MDDTQIESRATDSVWPLDNRLQTELKLEINRLIWTYGKPTMTLAEADKLAVKFFESLV